MAEKNFIVRNGLTVSGGVTIDSDISIGGSLTVGGAAVTPGLDSAEIKTLLSGGTGITYTEGTGAIATNDSEIVHDNLSGFVADEHVAHSTVSITAGDGLTGGGDISASRTINVVGGTGITVSADAVEITPSGVAAATYGDSSTIPVITVNDRGQVTAVVGASVNIPEGYTDANVDSHLSGGTGITYTSGVISTNDGQIVHDNLSGFVANEHINHSGVTITAGNGLTGGGDITTSRTITVGQGTGITVGSASISTNDAEIVHDNLSGFVANEHINHSSVSITAGTGLSGGGDITASRTINIANTGVSANTYGDAANIPQFTVNAQGQITGVTEISVDIPAGYDQTNFDSDLATKTTDNLTEGSTNLYYDSARTVTVAKNSVSATDAGGDGSFSYNAGTGVFTYTGPSASEVRAHFSAGTGVTLSSGEISIGQAVGTTDSVVFAGLETTGNLVVGGNLQVDGTTTTVNTENLSVSDNMLYMNDGESAGSPTLSIDVGWAANVNDPGSYQHVGMFRDATDDTFKVFEGYTPEPDAALEINTGHASFSLAPFAARTLTGKYLGADSDIDARLTGGTGITYSAGTISTNDGQIVHDNLSGFVANEHINHSSVSITAGSGLTGGGDITTSRTLNIGEGTGITVSADAISTNDGEIVHDNLSGFVANEHIDHTSVSITAGNGLTGGGTIAASRTINVGAGTGISVAADAISTNDGEIVHDNLSGFVANEHIDHTTVSITAGAGLTGGGTIAATRTLNIGAGTGITVNADDIAISNTGVSAATYGDSSTIPVITVNAQGQITAVVGAGVNIPAGYGDADVEAYLSGGTGIGFSSGVISNTGVTSVNSVTGAVTAANLLTAIKTVDGAGSGLDADLLDGQSGAYYRIDVYNAAGTLLN